VAWVGVFCGSSPGRPADQAATVAFAEALVAAGHGLVFGGASVGLMGLLADRVLAAGGPVVGVIPAGLWADEIAHQGLTELHTVDSLAARKALMAERSDAFVALPGGYGTLDELFEMITWTQLRLHDKPCGLLEVDGFWRDLERFLDGAGEAGFIRRRLLVSDEDPATLLAQLVR
jgi:hypothetical protein